MSSRIFWDYSDKYFEKDYPVTPLNGKRPFLQDWPNVTVESDDLKYADCGIGLICGKRSKIVAVDIDLQDEDEIKYVMSVLPPSPCSKVGKKGITLFYRYSGEESEKIKRGGLPIIEILSTGNQTVLPPSIHPETSRPYFWKTCDLLSLDHEELPFLEWEKYAPTLRRMSEGRIDAKKEIDRSVCSDRCRHGSWDTLKSYAALLASKGTNVEIAIQKLLDLDRSYNPKITFFTDPSRQHKSKDPYVNAVNLYAGMLTTISKKRDQKGLPSENPVMVTEVEPLFKQSHFSSVSCPQAMWRFCESLSKETETHSDYIFSSVLMAASALLGDQIRIYPRKSSSWFWRPKMSVCIVGNPSSRKSSAAVVGIDLIKHSYAKLIKERSQEIKKRKEKLKLSEIRYKNLKKDLEKMIESDDSVGTAGLVALESEIAELRRPLVKDLILNNATIQGTQSQMAMVAGAYIQQYDELSGWLEFIDSKMQAGSRAELLELMNQGVNNYKVTRKGEGLSLIIDWGHISIIGTIQEDMFHLFKKKKDGLLQRFHVINPIFCQPPRNEGHIRDYYAEGRMRDFFYYLMTSSSNDYSDAGDLFFDPEAEKFLWQFDEQIRLLASESDNTVQAYLNKVLTAFYNAASVFHTMEVFFCNRKTKMISIESACMAASVTQVLINYCIQQYTDKSVDKEGKDDREEKVFNKILEKFPDSSFGARDICRSCKLYSPDAMTDLLEKFAEIGRIKTAGKNRVGKPIYSI